jgi:hypothetical protein
MDACPTTRPTSWWSTGSVQHTQRGVLNRIRERDHEYQVAMITGFAPNIDNVNMDPDRETEVLRRVPGGEDNEWRVTDNVA